ncbi:MAG: hypothetical protein ACOX7I_07360 [Oscillospiraceae bacterium]|jgi:hypothetical protein
MKKVWKIVLIISLILVIAGCAIMGVAAFTGGSFTRLYDTVFSKLGIIDQINELLAYFQW